MIHSLKSAIKTFRKFLKTLPQIRKKYARYKLYKKDWDAFENIISLKEANKIDLDVVLLGSDEIWNTRQHSLRNPLMYGAGIRAKRKYGFAVSVGDMQEDGWDAYPTYLESINKLDGIFARDEQTKKVLKKYHVPVSGMLYDPTLQVDIRKYMKPVNAVSKIKDNYFAVYSYVISEKVKEYIQKFAQEHGLKIVAISLPQGWCDDYINCTPLEFGTVLNQASYVYTSTFHGTIFSTLYHTNFIVNPISYKVKDLIQKLDIAEFSFDDGMTYEDFCEVLEKKRSYEHVEKVILNPRVVGEEIYKKYIKDYKE